MLSARARSSWKSTSIDLSRVAIRTYRRRPRALKSWLKGGLERPNAGTIAFDRMVRFLQRGHSEVVVTGRWRLAVCALLMGVACILGVAIEAGANHSVTSWLSTAPGTGNGAFDASVEGFTDDGSQVFFQTYEP